MKRIYKKISERLSESAGIIGAILYGSYAREEETSRSDIDILLISKNEESKTDIQNLIIELEEEIDRIIQPTIRTLFDLKDTDSGLLQNIFEEGKILFLKEPLELPVGSLLNLKPFVIYSIKLNNLEQKEKAKDKNAGGKLRKVIVLYAASLFIFNRNNRTDTSGRRIQG